jgi:8-oxo-dGTP diphosphatase
MYALSLNNHLLSIQENIYGCHLAMKEFQMSSLHSSSLLQPTHVVTCFLQRTDEESIRILIVQRSQRVGSYHGHWAGISGFVEPNVPPSEQAFVEIGEETGLQRDQVQMLRLGTVVEHIDEALGRHFYIHPFLFAVATPEQIHTDWEAVDMRWIEPDELANYETVPRLQEAYASAIHGERVS